MSDFTATRAHVYTTGAVIYAAYHNSNENEIYNKHNGAMHATTGHGHTGATGDGPKISSTGLDLTASYAWTGTHTWTQDMALNGGTATTNFTLKTGTTTGTGHLYWKNSDSSKLFEWNADFTSGDVRFSVSTGSTSFFELSETNGFIHIYKDTAFGTTTKVYYDASSSHTTTLTGDTYDTESSANVMDRVVGGIVAQRLSWNTGSDVSNYNRGGTTTGTVRFIQVNSDSSAQFEMDSSFAAGNQSWLLQSQTQTGLVFSHTNLYVKSFLDLHIVSGKKFGLDSAANTTAYTGDTYLSESSANNIRATTGGATALDINSGGILVSAADPPVANYLTQKACPRGWVDLDGAAAMQADYNMSSTTSPGTGRYTLNWDRAFSTSNYVVQVTPNSATAGRTCQVFSRGTTSCEIRMYDSAAALTDMASLTCTFGVQ